MYSKGFTLIELLMVIILFSILAVVSTKVMLTGFSGYMKVQGITEADWQARVALERMVRDLKMIRANNAITTASSTQLTFTDITGVTVTYTRSGTTLLRNTNVLADGVSALNFTYSNNLGVATATLTAIRYVTINLTITTEHASYTFRTSVNLRDLT